MYFIKILKVHSSHNNVPIAKVGLALIRLGQFLMKISGFSYKCIYFRIFYYFDVYGTHTLVILPSHGIAQFSLERVDVLLVSINLVLQRFYLTNGLVLGLHKSSY